mgnify:CR=1 FL=1
MLPLQYIREASDAIADAMDKRGLDARPILSRILGLDEERRSLQPSLDQTLAEANRKSREIGTLFKAGKGAEAQLLKEESSKLKEHSKELQERLNLAADALQEALYLLPNVPHPSVPAGQDETDNPVVKVVGELPEFDFEPKAHWDIGTDLGILDFERAAKITGARFPLYYGAGARLERALINFMLDIHTQAHGYTETLPPFIVNRQSMTHTGQLPKFEQDLFKLVGWDYYLIPTAEVPVTNIHQGEILTEAQLPIYYTAYTPCFRSEAGSYGKDTRGLIRQHQFNKVELVKFTTPQTSYDELESLRADAETILTKLELSYQVIELCTGDLGFSAAKTYDLEVWMPAQGVYREISSCSNFENFQARRANIRFKKKGQKGTELVHTLNGSGLAVGRCLAAILENYQQADGSVTIPPALRSYMSGMEKITRETG